MIASHKRLSDLRGAVYILKYRVFCFRDIAMFLSKDADFNLTQLHSAHALLRVITFEFHYDNRKLES